MAHSYKSDYPADSTINDGIRQFFQTFYEISDTPDAHDTYANQFTKDATFILGTKKSYGHDGKLLDYECRSMS